MKEGGGKGILKAAIFGLILSGLWFAYIHSLGKIVDPRLESPLPVIILLGICLYFIIVAVVGLFYGVRRLFWFVSRRWRRE